MGQRIAVMKDGLLQQCDTPLQLYHHPANMFVAGFLGTPSMNFVYEGKLIKNGAAPLLDTGDFKVHLPESRAELLAPYVGREVVFGIRPQDIFDRTIAPPNVAAQNNLIRASVDVIERWGQSRPLFLNAGRQSFVAEVDAETRAKEGAPLDVLLDTENAHIFDKDTELAII